MRLAALATGLAVLASPALAQRAELVPATELRVCADPHHLPFSDQDKQGFENRIAEIIGRDLGMKVNYFWFPQTAGFVRNTLRARSCDLVMGTVSGDTDMETTSPYYHTGWMLVTRTVDGIVADAIGDPALSDKRFGLIAATPPTDLLLRHKLLDHTTSYPLMVDTRVSNPSRDMLRDLVDGKIDVALLAGPIAAYEIKQGSLPLRAVRLQSEPGAPRLDYRIAMGVRASEPEWRRRINQAIGRHRPEIAEVLAQFGLDAADDGAAPRP